MRRAGEGLERDFRLYGGQGEDWEGRGTLRRKGEDHEVV